MTVHYMFSAFDKETACGRSYKGLDITVHIVKVDCKSCKNAYKLNQIKEQLNGSTTVQRED